MDFECSVDLVGFLENTDTGLSPFFDLEAFVNAEKFRENNLFQDTDCQRFVELKKVYPNWYKETDFYYLLSGQWLRQWIRYIFVGRRLNNSSVGTARSASAGSEPIACGINKKYDLRIGIPVRGRTFSHLHFSSGTELWY